MCLLSDLDQKQQMRFRSPLHVPALYIYPTTQGIFTVCACGEENVLNLCRINDNLLFPSSFISYSADLLLLTFHF